MSNPASTDHVLDDVEYLFEYASSGKRFLNLLIDRIAIYFVWKFLLFKIDVAILTQIYRYTDSSVAVYLFGYLSAVGFFLLVIAAAEALSGGKTLGKLITGTRAVTQHGLPISAKTAMLRALIRLIPFEAFSALGNPCYPWHDRWTKTYVIDERLSSLPPNPA